MGVIIVICLLLLYLPWRLSRGFPVVARTAIVLIVAVKGGVLYSLHFNELETTGNPIVMDASVDAYKYYTYGEAFYNIHFLDISYEDLVAERGADAHMGYWVFNALAFKIAPEHPLLFIRMFKLLLFHVALGMLATTWRLRTSSGAAFAAYLVLGLVFYQFFYFTFRNLKDDMILSLFMMIMAVADRSVALLPEDRRDVTPKRMVWSWILIGFLTWLVSTIRFYLGIGIVCAFAMHTITSRGMKLSYRLLFAGAIALGFLALTTTAGFRMTQEEGGAGAVVGALGNFYLVFKVLVTPLPWQHAVPVLAFPHTVYLFMLPVALWAFFARFRSNLDWKLYVVVLVALVVGGVLQDTSPRKRFVMYPVFVSWIVMMGQRRPENADEPEGAAPALYFADARSAYA